ncbi:MAG: DEAD/DEAH box helicase [Oligoflexales bacterium]
MSHFAGARMNLDAFTRYMHDNYQGCIEQKETLPSEDPSFVSWPNGLNEKIKLYLQHNHIHSLYSHQLATFESLRKKHNTVVVAGTASGKTLSFLLPILQSYSEENFSTLLLYPTKALSRDQEGKLRHMVKAISGKESIGTFDGDTSIEDRKNLQQQADFVITNPDMLHSGILPGHLKRWKSFLSRLKYIVIDEVHIYRGAFGSHVSNVIRRLLRVCELHGANPTFIVSSATIANPKEHAENLCHLPFHLVHEDGCAKPERDIYLLNPPLVKNAQEAWVRKGPGSISVPLLKKATQLGVRTICFVQSRQTVERLVRSVRESLPTHLRDKVQPYRGGLLPSERRGLEKRIFHGEVSTIITTSALELGIDIGDLDICLLSGHPGSIASFWQRAGRVGRKGQKSAIIFLAHNNSTDQFMVRNPDFLTSQKIEKAWLNANNSYVFLQHLPCAAWESPLKDQEKFFPNELYDEARELLIEDKTLAPFHNSWRYALEDFPSRGVNLRGLNNHNIQIIHQGVVIGEIDPIGARGSLYKDAIYQHLGRRYMSINLDLDQKTCQVELVQLDYYTECVWEGRCEHTNIFSEKNVFGSNLRYGEIYVNKQPKLYKKIRERSFENIGYGPITLKAFTYTTSGISLMMSPDFRKKLHAQDPKMVEAAAYGLSYLIKQIAPSLCMADRNDFEADVSIEKHQEQEDAAIFLYDKLEGGVGYGEIIFHSIGEVLKHSLSAITHCACSMGCPACIPPKPPGVVDIDEDIEMYFMTSNACVEATKSWLHHLIEGVWIAPKIKTEKLASPATHMQTNPEAIIRHQQLSSAARILRKKRLQNH